MLLNLSNNIEQFWFSINRKIIDFFFFSKPKPLRVFISSFYKKVYFFFQHLILKDSKSSLWFLIYHFFYDKNKLFRFYTYLKYLIFDFWLLFIKLPFIFKYKITLNIFFSFYYYLKNLIKYYCYFPVVFEYKILFIYYLFTIYLFDVLKSILDFFIFLKYKLTFFFKLNILFFWTELFQNLIMNAYIYILFLIIFFSLYINKLYIFYFLFLFFIFFFIIGYVFFKIYFSIIHDILINNVLGKVYKFILKKDFSLLVEFISNLLFTFRIYCKGYFLNTFSLFSWSYVQLNLFYKIIIMMLLSIFEVDKKSWFVLIYFRRRLFINRINSIIIIYVEYVIKTNNKIKGLWKI
jgi:hypothetical protein